MSRHFESIEKYSKRLAKNIFSCYSESNLLFTHSPSLPNRGREALYSNCFGSKYET